MSWVFSFFKFIFCVSHWTHGILRVFFTGRDSPLGRWLSLDLAEMVKTHCLYLVLPLALCFCVATAFVYCVATAFVFVLPLPLLDPGALPFSVVLPLPPFSKAVPLRRSLSYNCYYNYCSAPPQRHCLFFVIPLPPSWLRHHLAILHLHDRAVTARSGPRQSFTSAAVPLQTRSSRLVVLPNGIQLPTSHGELMLYRCKLTAAVRSSAAAGGCRARAPEALGLGQVAAAGTLRPAPPTPHINCVLCELAAKADSEFCTLCRTRLMAPFCLPPLN